MRGPSEIGDGVAARRGSRALVIGEAAFGADQDQRRPGLERRRRRLAAASRRRNRACAPSRLRATPSASPARRSRAGASARIARRLRSRSLRSRSSLTRSATVRWVMTGISRAAPSSVAFSTSQSVWARLTGANASQTSGIVSGSRVCRSTREGHAFLAGLGDARQPFARAAVEQQHFAPSPSRMHIAEIIGLAGIEIDVRAFAKRLAHEQARQAFRRPGRGRGHGRPNRLRTACPGPGGSSAARLPLSAAAGDLTSSARHASAKSA